MKRKSLLLAGFLVCFSATTALAAKPILIGTPLPLTGPYASDGEQMKMALELAAEEYNAAGGLLGGKIEIKFGDVGGLEAEKIKAVGERLIGAGANAIITGYDDGGVDTKVFGQYDVPYLHGNAMTLCTAPVAENPEQYWNVSNILTMTWPMASMQLTISLPFPKRSGGHRQIKILPLSRWIMLTMSCRLTNSPSAPKSWATKSSSMKPFHLALPNGVRFYLKSNPNSRLT